ncbi:MAG: hypothetical protein KAG56_02165 [Sulfurovaceae bacterium]|nr:hypothetical protein [Sulfurovaceae bacterium]
MKKILNIFLLLLLFSMGGYASTRGDVKIIEASENIRLLGQKIAKDYLYFYKNSKKLELKEGLYKDIEMLEHSILEISMITKNSDSKNILDFLSYNKDEIKELLSKKVSRENSILMLDYGESFLEGANSIAKEHAYIFSDEEQMLMSLKKMEYLLERTTKYYIATALNLDKNNNFKSMKESIVKVEQILKKINTYAYPEELLGSIEKMNSIWSKHKEFLYKSNELSVPNLLLSSEKILEDIVVKIALYHKQNQ